MASSSRAIGALVVLACAHAARAQPAAQGFAVERLVPAPAGAAWLVMDDLDLHGGIGGALSLTLGYARDPLRVSDAVTQLAVVSGHMLTDIGGALTYDRWRFSIDFQTELDTSGASGSVGGYAFTAPDVNPGAVLHPDTIGDVRVGVDARLFGEPGDRWRLGASAQLWIPNGDRADYDTDGTFRASVRGLVAGDAGRFAYAGYVGVHIRPLDDAGVPGSPRGSELLFGVGGGVKLPVACGARWRVVIGPEIYGASAFAALFGSDTTGLEALVAGRIEDTRVGGRQLRVRLAVGRSLLDAFGAPAWRIVASVEMFGRHR